ncbi:hypothetical protein [Nitrospira sp. Kam-Ns4a]
MNESEGRVWQNIVLLRSLFHQHHVLSDRAQHLWIFRERFVNGRTLSYFLDGRSRARIGLVSARLTAQIYYRSDPDGLEAYLQDITVGRPDHHVGTWMVNRWLVVLQTLHAAIPVCTVALEWNPVDARTADNQARRARFFQRFGFVLPESGQGFRASTPFEHLQLVHRETITLWSVEELLWEWMQWKQGQQPLS